MIHMIMVLRIWSRNCNHLSRGNLNDTGSVINTSQIRTNLIERLECVSEKVSEVKGTLK